MHIGIDARLTYYRVGGISTYIRRLVQALETLDAENHYTVFHSRKAADSLVTRFHRSKLWTPAHHRLERLVLTVELARFGLDLLHSPDFIAPYRGAERHVITVHDLTFLHYPQYLTADSRRYYNDQIQVATRHADHILADSEATKTDLVSMLDVPPEKITVHMLGVDESFQPLSAEMLEKCRQQYNLPEAYILFVGTFEPRKNIVGLVEAYKLLLEKIPDAPPLLLFGKPGWLFEETMARVKALGVEEHLIWCDDLPYDALPVVYNLAKMLVTPSFYEGFGLPALEAMACGTVPIVSKHSSLPEVVGDVGLQVNPDDTSSISDAMYHALTDTAWREQMRAAGLARSKLFTWQNTAEITLSVYRRVLEQGQ